MESPSDVELHAILGTRWGDDADALRAAYLAKIREHPPERDPAAFERIRDAYQTLSDPKRRMRRCFDSADLRRPMRDLLRDLDGHGGRAVLGTAAWLGLLRHAEQGRREGRGGGA